MIRPPFSTAKRQRQMPGEKEVEKTQKDFPLIKPKKLFQSKRISLRIKTSG
jgi:hypothetical protein